MTPIQVSFIPSAGVLSEFEIIFSFAPGGRQDTQRILGLCYRVHDLVEFYGNVCVFCTEGSSRTPSSKLQFSTRKVGFQEVGGDERCVPQLQSGGTNRNLTV